MMDIERNQMQGLLWELKTDATEVESRAVRLRENIRVQMNPVLHPLDDFDLPSFVLDSNDFKEAMLKRGVLLSKISRAEKDLAGRG